MINLAGFRYRNAFAEQGGPIARVETTDFPIEKKRMFQANAYLRPDLIPRKRKQSVYSDAAGTGTHESPMVARFMAISEAMERWAYHQTVYSPQRADYGFDADPMSNGMAAFPGLLHRQARHKARLEAIERFSMMAWWEGLLPAAERETEWPGVDAAVLPTGGSEVVVILHKKTAEGLHAYGHAAGENFSRACRRAVLELARHQYVIRSYWLARSCGCALADQPSDLLERRSVFFASPEGHERFVRRVKAAVDGPAPARRMIFDGRIPGPWERYASVWRVVFHPVSERYLREGEQYFLW
jgi:ribosomal protein S12 methylthiotransferase accessory factor YcaO